MNPSDDALARTACVPEHPDAAQTIAYRRSLRASRTRRGAAAMRRRRRLRSRGSMIAATAGLLFASGGAIAAQHSVSGGQRGASSATIAAAQAALGVPADGVAGPVTRAATKRFQRTNGLTVDGVIGPQTLSALGVAVKVIDKGVRAAAAAVADPVLARIAACESGGDPTAVSADGRYHGKYQFSRATWRTMGGSGNPARAPEAEQDRIAAKLLARAGTSPWPNCG
jgi:hypothetical protein